MKEVEFSRDIVQRLRRLGYTVTRIESGLTKRGIPDLYVSGHHRRQWIELKVNNAVSVLDESVPFRPGQVAWMYGEYLASGDPPYTICKYTDCIKVIRVDNLKGTTVRKYPNLDFMKEDISIWGIVKNEER